MPYADKTYYRNTYIGRAISVDADLDAALARAAEIARPIYVLR